MTGFLLLGNPGLAFAQTADAAPEPALQLSASSMPASDIVARTNQMRLEAGVGTVVVNSRLSRSAQLKAEDMATKGYFAHENAEGQRLAYWLGVTGYAYKYAGENLAVGYQTPAGAMNGWKNSPTHYANIIKPEYREMGVGVAVGSYKGASAIFVVQHFGATQQLVIPVAENVELAVKPAVVPAPVAEPAVTAPVAKPAPAFIETATVPAAPQPLSFNLVEVAQASPVVGEGQPVNTAPVIPETTQAVIAIVVLMLLATLYVELEGNMAYWRELLVA